MFFLLLFQSERRSAGSTATVFRQFAGFISFYVNARKSIDTQVEVEKEYTFRSLLECSFLRKIKYFLYICFSGLYGWCKLLELKLSEMLSQIIELHEFETANMIKLSYYSSVKIDPQ